MRTEACIAPAAVLAIILATAIAFWLAPTAEPPLDPTTIWSQPIP